MEHDARPAVFRWRADKLQTVFCSLADELWAVIVVEAAEN